jgi:hypothetical protein
METIMSKSALKFLFSAGLLASVAGCAQTQNERVPVYSELPTRSVAPTSDQSTERVYAGQENAAPTAPPSGVTAEDWALNDRIRNLFLDNKKLAPPPSEVTAVVDQKEHGVVHLSGHIVNGVARRRVIEEVSKIPGVTRVDDQMAIGARQPDGTADLRKP